MVGHEKNHGRLTGILVLFILVAMVIIARLFVLQVVSADYYRSVAENQRTIAHILTPQRGNIFFQDKTGTRIPAATTKVVYTLYVNPKTLTNAEHVFNILQDILDIDQEEFLEKANDTTSTFKIVRKDIEKQIAAKIATLDLEGVGLVPEETRAYPGGTLASHVLGFVGFLDNQKAGLYGIEKQYNDLLQGGFDDGLDSESAAGALLSFGRKMFDPKPDGADLVLTLDPNVESYMEQRLLEVQEKWNARGAGGIVMDPKTGKILAMGAIPNFDPNQYGKEKNFDVFLNPFVQKMFEMGSVVKPLTVAAALDARAITPHTEYNDTGRLVIDGAKIENFDGKSRGVIPMDEILKQSLNVGAVFVMRQLGPHAFRDYFEKYGLGERTGIDLPNEVSGNLSNLYTNREIEFATASYGQGIAVTPIELAAALSTLGNGGELIKPYVVDKVMSGEITVKQTQPQNRRQTLKKGSSETISRMLTAVVDETLADGQAKIPGYNIAAKTGTAQVASKNGKGYSDNYFHTYFGYAPSFDPRFLVLLYLDHPQGVKYSSQSLTETFRSMMQFLITYYEIPSDEIQSVE